MARGRKVGVTISETIEQQIEKAVDALQKLLDKREALRKDTLWKAIIYSGKSYEEILLLSTLHKRRIFRRKNTGS